MRSKPSTLAIRIRFDGLVGDEALRVLEAQLREEPESVEVRFAGGRLLEELGRPQDARGAYEGVLARDPRHFGALLNLGTLFFGQGRFVEARVLYTKAMQQHPQQPAGFVNLGTVLAETGDGAGARAAYEAALQVEPAHPTAHYALALLAEQDGDAERAAAHRRAAFVVPIVHRRPFRGTGIPPRVLTLLAADGGNLVTTLLLDERRVAVSELVVESQPPDAPLPVHDVLFNTIGDADRAADALTLAAAVAERSSAPRLNDPRRIARTRRVDVAERLAGIDGLTAPRTALLERDDVTADALRARGFAFPVLLRAAGHHMGEHFELIGAEHDLAPALARLPAGALYAIAFLDGRGDDRRFRKYRVLFVGGGLYPLHLAIGDAWKLHYFSSQMHASAMLRAEEARFLAAPETVLGARAIAALRSAERALALDYGGIDFGLDRDGNVLLYEANATMAIYPVPDDERFAYRRTAVAAAVAAARTLVEQHAAHA